VNPQCHQVEMVESLLSAPGAAGAGTLELDETVTIQAMEEWKKLAGRRFMAALVELEPELWCSVVFDRGALVLVMYDPRIPAVEGQQLQQDQLAINRLRMMATYWRTYQLRFGFAHHFTAISVPMATTPELAQPATWSTGYFALCHLFISLRAPFNGFVAQLNAATSTFVTGIARDGGPADDLRYSMGKPYHTCPLAFHRGSFGMQDMKDMLHAMCKIYIGCESLTLHYVGTGRKARLTYQSPSSISTTQKGIDLKSAVLKHGALYPAALFPTLKVDKTVEIHTQSALVVTGKALIIKRNQLPRDVITSWTEQYAGRATILGCDTEGRPQYDIYVAILKKPSEAGCPKTHPWWIDRETMAPQLPKKYVKDPIVERIYLNRKRAIPPRRKRAREEYDEKEEGEDEEYDEDDENDEG
jgi:hypothetical protein